jgi:3-hydroxyisobutyrate dehydrogenase-like beta-hydroxyacid dehydrogenase
MILGVTMIATCEAFALADKLGLDRQAMFDVVSTSSGYSWTMNAYCPAPGVGPQSARRQRLQARIRRRADAQGPARCRRRSSSGCCSFAAMAR